MNVDSRKRVSKHHLASEDPDEPDDLSLLHHKKLKTDNGCNNNMENSPKTGGWVYSADTSLVESEIMEEMGVSMLDEEEKYDCPNDELTQEPVLSLRHTEELRQTLAKEKNFAKDDVTRGSSFESVNNNRDVYNNDESESSTSSKDLDTSQNQSLKDDDMNLDDFFLLKRRRRAFVGENHFQKLSDEMILMIFKWLPMKSLVRSMSVCKRWYGISQDEVLWTRLDLSSKVLNDGALGNIIPRGLQMLRLAQANVHSPVFQSDSMATCSDYRSKLQYLDLSMAVISPEDLGTLLKTCRSLKKLSLEKCTLNQACCDAIGKNKELTILNLTMCSGLDLQGVKSLMQLKKLSELNVAWCNFDSETVTYLCSSLPKSITRLNISGCRRTIEDKNIRDLVKACPNVIELDLSDCVLLTTASIQSMLHLEHLEHLSISRCFSLTQPPTSNFLHLIYTLNLRYLNIFGSLKEQTFEVLTFNCRNTEMNKYRFSSIARPTVGSRRTSIWGLRIRD